MQQTRSLNGGYQGDYVCNRCNQPQVCSPDVLPLWQCHRVAAVSDTWSLCRRSCPLCSMQAAAQDWCGRSEGWLGPYDDVPIALARRGSGRMPCHCRRAGRPHPHSPAVESKTAMQFQEDGGVFAFSTATGWNKGILEQKVRELCAAKFTRASFPLVYNHRGSGSSLYTID